VRKAFITIFADNIFLMSIKKYLLALALLCSCTFVKSQTNVVYQNTEKTDIDISFVSNPDINQEITNYFISELARSIPKKAEFTKYKFTCNRIDRITETDPGKFSATYEITDVSCTGDVYYKNFSIAEVLIPTSCSFVFNVFSDKAIPLYQQTSDNVIINTGYNILASFSFQDTSKQKKFNTRIENFAFHFNEEARQQFNEKLKLIDDYYLSESTFEQCNEQLRDIDFENIDMIIVYDIKLKELEKTFDHLYKTDYPGKLGLVNNDPVQFLEKLNKLSDTLYRVRQRLNLKLENLDKLYYEKGLYEIKNDENEKAETYFNRSILYNSAFVPSQLELAKIWYKHDSLGQAADKMSMILHTLNPAPDIYKQVILYTDTIYKKMLALGSEFNRTEMFNESIAIFEKCVSFCDGLPGYNCSDDHVKGLAVAHFGIYKSYLSVSRKAIDKGKLELAEAYISDAIKYQKKYNNFIINDAEAISLLEKLVNAFIAKGDTLNSKKNFEKALFIYEKASDLSEKSNLILPENFNKGVTKAHNGIYNNILKKCQQQAGSGFAEAAEKTLNDAIEYQKIHGENVKPSLSVDSLLTKIKSLRYNDLIKSGLISLAISDFQSALNHFDQATEIEQKFFITKNEKLDSLVQLCAKPILLNQIIYTDRLLETGNTDSASSLATEIKQSIVLHRLSNDSTINAQLIILKTKIYNTRCRNAKDNYNLIRKQADKAIAQQNYISSDTLFSNAIDLSEKYPDCHIDPSEAINGKKNYLLACNYQKMLETASHSLFQKDYNSFFYYYSEAETFFETMQISNVGLVHQKLKDKIIMSSDSAFTKAAVDFMIQKERPEDALLCIKTLQKLNFTAEKTKNIQQQTGVIMARKDHAVNAGSNPSVLVISYTANNKWLSYFKTAYIKAWKSLNKK